MDEIQVIATIVEEAGKVALEELIADWGNDRGREVDKNIWPGVADRYEEVLISKMTDEIGKNFDAEDLEILTEIPMQVLKSACIPLLKEGLRNHIWRDLDKEYL